MWKTPNIYGVFVDVLAGVANFESDAFNHSATLPTAYYQRLARVLKTQN